MVMTTFLPSEFARLILGYLEENGYSKSSKAVLEEIPELAEFAKVRRKGQKVSLLVGNNTLEEMLTDYSSSRSHVRESKKNHPAILRKVSKSDSLYDQVKVITSIACSKGNKSQNLASTLLVGKNNPKYNSRLLLKNLRIRQAEEEAELERRNRRRESTATTETLFIDVNATLAESLPGSNLRHSVQVDSGKIINANHICSPPRSPLSTPCNISPEFMNASEAGPSTSYSITTHDFEATPQKRKGLAKRRSAEHASNSNSSMESEANFEKILRNLYENTALHEKIAENINKGLNTQGKTLGSSHYVGSRETLNVDDNMGTAQAYSNSSGRDQHDGSHIKPRSSSRREGLAGDNALIKELDHVVTGIITETTADPVFENFIEEVFGTGSNPSSPAKRSESTQVNQDAAQDACSGSARPLSTPVPPVILADKVLVSSHSSHMTSLPHSVQLPLITSSSSTNCYASHVNESPSNCGRSGSIAGESNLQSAKRLLMKGDSTNDQIPQDQEIISGTYSSVNSPSRERFDNGLSSGEQPSSGPLKASEPNGSPGNSNNVTSRKRRRRRNGKAGEEEKKLGDQLIEEFSQFQSSRPDRISESESNTDCDKSETSIAQVGDSISFVECPEGSASPLKSLSPESPQIHKVSKNACDNYVDTKSSLLKDEIAQAESNYDCVGVSSLENDQNVHQSSNSGTCNSQSTINSQVPQSVDESLPAETNSEVFESSSVHAKGENENSDDINQVSPVTIQSSTVPGLIGCSSVKVYEDSFQPPDQNEHYILTNLEPVNPHEYHEEYIIQSSDGKLNPDVQYIMDEEGIWTPVNTGIQEASHATAATSDSLLPIPQNSISIDGQVVDCGLLIQQNAQVIQTPNQSTTTILLPPVSQQDVQNTCLYPIPGDSSENPVLVVQIPPLQNSSEQLPLLEIEGVPVETVPDEQVLQEATVPDEQVLQEASMEKPSRKVPVRKPSRAASRKNRKQTPKSKSQPLADMALGGGTTVFEVGNDSGITVSISKSNGNKKGRHKNSPLKGRHKNSPLKGRHKNSPLKKPKVEVNKEKGRRGRPKKTVVVKKKSFSFLFDKENKSQNTVDREAALKRLGNSQTESNHLKGSDNASCDILETALSFALNILSPTKSTSGDQVVEDVSSNNAIELPQISESEVEDLPSIDVPDTVTRNSTRKREQSLSTRKVTKSEGKVVKSEVKSRKGKSAIKKVNSVEKKRQSVQKKCLSPSGSIGKVASVENQEGIGSSDQGDVSATGDGSVSPQLKALLSLTTTVSPSNRNFPSRKSVSVYKSPTHVPSKRGSQSTPRRKTSHIRVLDFGTPQKRVSPNKAQKLSKGLKLLKFTPIKKGLKKGKKIPPSNEKNNKDSSKLKNIIEVDERTANEIVEGNSGSNDHSKQIPQQEIENVSQNLFLTGDQDVGRVREILNQDTDDEESFVLRIDDDDTCSLGPENTNKDYNVNEVPTFLQKIVESHQISNGKCSSANSVKDPESVRLTQTSVASETVASQNIFYESSSIGIDSLSTPFKADGVPSFSKDYSQTPIVLEPPTPLFVSSCVSAPENNDLSTPLLADFPGSALKTPLIKDYPQGPYSSSSAGTSYYQPSERSVTDSEDFSPSRLSTVYETSHMDEFSNHPEFFQDHLNREKGDDCNTLTEVLRNANSIPPSAPEKSDAVLSSKPSSKKIGEVLEKEIDNYLSAVNDKNSRHDNNINDNSSCSANKGEESPVISKDFVARELSVRISPMKCKDSGKSLPSDRKVVSSIKSIKDKDKLSNVEERGCGSLENLSDNINEEEGLLKLLEKRLEIGKNVNCVVVPRKLKKKRRKITDRTASNTSISNSTNCSERDTINLSDGNRNVAYNLLQENEDFVNGVDSDSAEQTPVSVEVSRKSDSEVTSSQGRCTVSTASDDGTKGLVEVTSDIGKRSTVSPLRELCKESNDKAESTEELESNINSSDEKAGKDFQNNSKYFDTFGSGISSTDESETEDKDEHQILKNENILQQTDDVSVKSGDSLPSVGLRRSTRSTKGLRMSTYAESVNKDSLSCTNISKQTKGNKKLKTDQGKAVPNASKSKNSVSIDIQEVIIEATVQSTLAEDKIVKNTKSVVSDSIETDGNDIRSERVEKCISKSTEELSNDLCAVKESLGSSQSSVCDTNAKRNSVGNKDNTPCKGYATGKTIEDAEGKLGQNLYLDSSGDEFEATPMPKRKFNFNFLKKVKKNPSVKRKQPITELVTDCKSREAADDPRNSTNDNKRKRKDELKNSGDSFEGEEDFDTVRTAKKEKSLKTKTNNSLEKLFDTEGNGNQANDEKQVSKKSKKSISSEDSESKGIGKKGKNMSKTKASCTDQNQSQPNAKNKKNRTINESTVGENSQQSKMTGKSKMNNKKQQAKMKDLNQVVIGVSKTKSPKDLNSSNENCDDVSNFLTGYSVIPSNESSAKSLHRDDSVTEDELLDEVLDAARKTPPFSVWGRTAVDIAQAKGEKILGNMEAKRLSLEKLHANWSKSIEAYNSSSDVNVTDTDNDSPEKALGRLLPENLDLTSHLQKKRRLPLSNGCARVTPYVCSPYKQGLSQKQLHMDIEGEVHNVTPKSRKRTRTESEASCASASPHRNIKQHEKDDSGVKHQLCFAENEIDENSPIERESPSRHNVVLKSRKFSGEGITLHKGKEGTSGDSEESLMFLDSSHVYEIENQLSALDSNILLDAATSAVVSDLNEKSSELSKTGSEEQLSLEHIEESLEMKNDCLISYKPLPNTPEKETEKICHSLVKEKKALLAIPNASGFSPPGQSSKNTKALMQEDIAQENSDINYRVRRVLCMDEPTKENAKKLQQNSSGNFTPSDQIKDMKDMRCSPSTKSLTDKLPLHSKIDGDSGQQKCEIIASSKVERQGLEKKDISSERHQDKASKMYAHERSSSTDDITTDYSTEGIEINHNGNSEEDVVSAPESVNGNSRTTVSDAEEPSDNGRVQCAMSVVSNDADENTDNRKQEMMAIVASLDSVAKGAINVSNDVHPREDVDEVTDSPIDRRIDSSEAETSDDSEDEEPFTLVFSELIDLFSQNLSPKKNRNHSLEVSKSRHKEELVQTSQIREEASEKSQSKGVMSKKSECDKELLGMSEIKKNKSTSSDKPGDCAITDDIGGSLDNSASNHTKGRDISAEKCDSIKPIEKQDAKCGMEKTSEVSNIGAKTSSSKNESQRRKPRRIQPIRIGEVSKKWKNIQNSSGISIESSGDKDVTVENKGKGSQSERSVCSWSSSSPGPLHISDSPRGAESPLNNSEYAVGMPQNSSNPEESTVTTSSRVSDSLDTLSNKETSIESLREPLKRMEMVSSIVDTETSRETDDSLGSVRQRKPRQMSKELVTGSSLEITHGLNKEVAVYTSQQREKHSNLFMSEDSLTNSMSSVPPTPGKYLFIPPAPAQTVTTVATAQTIKTAANPKFSTASSSSGLQSVNASVAYSSSQNTTITPPSSKSTSPKDMKTLKASEEPQPCQVKTQRNFKHVVDYLPLKKRRKIYKPEVVKRREAEKQAKRKDSEKSQ